MGPAIFMHIFRFPHEKQSALLSTRRRGLKGVEICYGLATIRLLEELPML